MKKLIKKIIIVSGFVLAILLIFLFVVGLWNIWKTNQLNKYLNQGNIYRNEEIGWTLDFEQREGTVTINGVQNEVRFNRLQYRFILEYKDEDPSTDNYTMVGMYICNFKKDKLILTNIKNNEKITLYKV